MIVLMKKATLLVIPKEQRQAVKKLRELGVMHVHPVQPPQSDDMEGLKAQLGRAGKALLVLGETEPDGKAADIPGEQTVNQLLQLSEEQTTLFSKLEEVHKTRAWFDVWGEVTLDSIQTIEEAGVTPRCYKLDKAAMKTIPENLNLQILGEEQGVIYAVLFAQSDEEKLDFKEEIMPRVQVSELDKTIQTLQIRIAEIDQEIQSSINQKLSILNYMTSIQKDLDYHTVLAGTGSAENLIYLQGFIPAETVPSLEKLAEVEGWGTIFEDPEDPAEVPTLLKNSRIPRIIEPLFKFMGTLPGYHEVDVSLVFLLFFSLFYAMIIGDAGYGLVFLAGTAYFRFKNKKAPIEPFALFYVLSGTTILWGILTGTWFGSRAIAEWPLLRQFVIEPMFSFNDSKEATLYMMRLSFMLGLAHLVIAHFMSFLRKMPSLSAIAQLGWILICGGLFFVVDLLVLSNPFPGFAKIMIIAGISIVGIFTNFQKNPLKLIGSFLGTIANSIQDVIAAFSDIVSYIRLFAVGLAGVTVAASFNDMAGGIFAPIVLILGHGLNIILGLMSVMVHGVRLNMLEFSGHLGQEWTGRPYEPFKE
ncbi:hypothetical protein HQ585_00385 [candidate division KSB1 bacterium]|nr:hypothetical protein [candidate division KSB1 bacterium]